MMRTERSCCPFACVVRSHGEELLPVRVRRALGGDARAAVQLAHDHALRAVDHERAVLGHHGKVAQEHVLLVDVLAVLEAERGVQRLGVRLALVERLLVRPLGRPQEVLHEVQHVPAVVRGDREDLVEDRLETLHGPLRRRNVLLEELLV